MNQTMQNGKKTLMCARCHYETSYLGNLRKHYMRVVTCDGLFSNQPTEELLKALSNDDDKRFRCEFCEKKFTSSQSKYNHKQICKVRKKNQDNNTRELNEIKDEVKALKQMLSQHYKLPEKNSQRKPEKYYQAILESYLGGTHKKLSCGITDITTNTCHAEVKEWNGWKEAIGQLICYNKAEPKQTLALYMFGKYTESCKRQAVNTALECNMNIHEFVEVEDRIVIKDLSNGEIVYSHIV